MPQPTADGLHQDRARRTRQRVLDAALRRFAADGYRGTSVAAVAAEAGVTDAGLLYHFPTKQDLLLAVLVAHNHQEREVLNRWYRESGGGIGFLRALAGWGEHMERASSFTSLLVILSAEHLLDDSDVNGYFRARYDRSIGDLTRILGEAKARKEIRADVDAEAEARSVLAVMDGSRLQYYFTDGRASMAAAVRFSIDQLIERIAR